MPVRRIPMGRRSLTGAHHWDPRASGVAFESSLERDFITLMLLEPSVLSIEEQPVRVSFSDGARSRRYTPDFLVHFNDAQSRLVEIKYQEELLRKADELTPKFDAAAVYANERGWIFEVWSEIDIRNQRLVNAKFLVPFTRQTPDPGVAARLINHFQSTGAAETTVEDLLKSCWRDRTERTRGIRAVWSLVASRRLLTDLDQALNNKTVLRLREEDICA